MLNETLKTDKHWIKSVLILVMMITLGSISWLIYQDNPELFKADLSTGTETAPGGYTLYIPNDYTANENDVGELEVKAAVDMDDIENFGIAFQYVSEKISVKGINTVSGDYFHGISTVYISNAGTAPFTVRFDHDEIAAAVTPVTAGSTLFRLEVELLPGFRSGQASIGATIGSSSSCPSTSDYYFCAKSVGGGSYITSPEFRDGVVSVTSGAPLGEGDICEQLGDCSGNGYCDGIQCVCDPGYDGPRCNACEAGFTGYPDCTEDIFSNLKAAILTLGTDAISNLGEAERKKAYSSVYMIVKSSMADGKKITIEGDEITLHQAGATELEKINYIAGSLIEGMDINETVGVNASFVPGVEGVLKLESANGNPDASLDGISTTSGEVLIVPAMEYTLMLHPSASYKVRVVGVDQDAVADTNAVRDLSYSDLTWMPQPTNRLKSDALAGGLLERGDTTGKGPVYVQVERADAAPIRSNEITVEVPSGPIIEYMRRIGSSPIVKGGRVTFTVKVSDVDQISDIQYIETSVVRSTADTYGGINADGSAIWFTATPFINEVTVSDSGSETPEGEATPQYFKVYSIPVEIPQSQDLTDGPYKIVLSITDAGNNESNAVTTIAIGNVANGDVNGDGNVTMIDVIMAFQIATGENNAPTAAQIRGADMNNNGTVTMLDIITLFDQVNQ